MKKILAIAAAVVVSAVTTYGQGAVAFKNFGTGSNGSIAFGSASVRNVDGTTLLSGNGFTAELYIPSTSTSLTPTVGFGTGALAGTFNPTPGVTVPGVAIGATATFVVRVWDNQAGSVTSFDTATIRGQSSPIAVTLGDPQNPTSLPILVGMTSFNLAVVPEPSVIALAVVGVGALLLRRRKA